jgi:plasmid maintenance system killer protein
VQSDGVPLWRLVFRWSENSAKEVYLDDHSYR